MYRLIAQVTLVVDEVGLEPALKQVADAPMAQVEVAGVTAVEMLHAGREIRLGRLDEQVLGLVMRQKACTRQR